MLTIRQTNLVEANTQDLFNEFISYLDISTKSVSTYTQALKVFSEYLKANNISLKQVTREDIINFRESCKERNLKNTTIALYIIVVRRLFGWLETLGFQNVARNIKGAKVSKEHKKDALTLEQTKKILNTIDRSTIPGLRDYALILLAVTTGLRTIEIQRADIKDIKSVQGKKVLFVQGKGKNDKADFVILTEYTAIAINTYLQVRKTTDSDATLFASHSARNEEQRMHVKSISRIVKTALRKAGIDNERITAHSLRHTAATLNLLHGGTLEDTKQLLRHTSINTTMIYAHHLDKLKSCSADRIQDAIFCF